MILTAFGGGRVGAALVNGVEGHNLSHSLGKPENSPIFAPLGDCPSIFWLNSYEYLLPPFLYTTR